MSTNTSCIQTPTNLNPGQSLWPAAGVVAHPRLFVPLKGLTFFQNTWNSAPLAAVKSAFNESTAIGQALQYLATGNAANATNAFNAANGEPNIKQSSSQTLTSPATPFVLDWCYPALSGSQRTTLINQCDSFCTSNEAYFTGASGGFFGISDGFTDYGLSGYILCGLAAEGEAGFTSRLQKIRFLMQNTALYWGESSSDGYIFTYGDLPYRSLFLWAAYFIAVGQSNLTAGLFQGLANHPIFQARRASSTSQSYVGGVKGLAYLSLSSDSRGGASGYETTRVGDGAPACFTFAQLLGNTTAGGIAQWLGAQCLAQNNQGGWGSGGDSLHITASWLGAMFYDPNKTQVNVNTLPLCQNLTLSPVAVGTLGGWTNMRSAWPLGTGLNAWFFSRPDDTGNHDNSYSGHFEILRDENYLLASGYNYAGRGTGALWETGNGDATISGSVGNYSMCRNCAMFVRGTPNISSWGAHRSGSQCTAGASNGPQANSQAIFPNSWRLRTNLPGIYAGGTTVRFNDFTNTAKPECCVVGDIGGGYDTNQINIAGAPTTGGYQRYFSYCPGSTNRKGTYIVRDVFTTAGGVTNCGASFWTKAKPTLTGTQTVQQGSSSAGVIRFTGNSFTYAINGAQVTVQAVGGSFFGYAVGGTGFESMFDFSLSNGSGGGNLDFAQNFQGSTGDNRNAPEYAWIQGQWRVEFWTTPSAANGEMLFVITVDDTGVTAPVYTRSQAAALAPVAFTNNGQPVNGPGTNSSSATLAGHGTLAATAQVIYAAVPQTMVANGALSCALAFMPLQLGVAANIASASSFGLNINSPAGATIVVLVGSAGNNATFTGVTDTQNGSYNLAGQSAASAGAPTSAVFYIQRAKALVAGTDTIKVTGATYYAIAYGLPAGFVFEATVNSSSASASSANESLPSLAGFNEAIFGSAIINGGAGTYTESPGFTSGNNPSGGVFFGAYEQILNGTSATYAPSWTAANPMAASIASFPNSAQVVCIGLGAIACDAATLSPHVQSASATLVGVGAIPADARPTEWWLGSIGAATVNVTLTTQFNVLPGESILVLASSNASGTQATACADSAGNNYTLVDVGANAPNETHIITCSRCLSGLPAGGTITVSFAGAATDHLVEAFGCRESLTTDVGSALTVIPATATSSSTSTGILGASQEIVWAHIVFSGNPGAVAIAAPFKLADAVISNNIYAVSAYVRVASTASVTASWSWATARSAGSHFESFITVNFATTAANLAGAGALFCDTVQTTVSTVIAGNGGLICDGRPTKMWLGYIGGNGTQLNLTTLQNVFAGESIVLFGSSTGVGQQGTSAADSSGNTYTLIDNGPNFTLETQLFACLVLTADLPAGSVISMAFAGAAADHLLEAYMVYGALSVDWGTSGNAGTGTSTPSRTSATFVQAEEIAFTHICWNANPGSVGLGAPFFYATLGAPTNPPTAGLINQSTDLYALTGYRRLHSTAPLTYQHTWPTSVGFREHGFSFAIGQLQQAGVVLIGQGAVNATTAIFGTDFLAMSGQGAIACDSVHTVFDTAESLAGAGTLSSDSSTFSGTISASSPVGAGALTATAFIYEIGLPLIAGLGTFTGGSTNRIQAATALLQGTGAVVPATKHTPIAAASLAGHGAIAVPAAIYAIDNGTILQGASVLFAFPGGLFAAAELDGDGEMPATAVQWVSDPGPETFAGDGEIAIASAQAPTALAAMVGAGSLSARAATKDSASASILGADGEISVAVLIVRVAPSILVGTGAIAFAGNRETFGTASLSDLSSLVCFPIQKAAASIVASGSGSIAASAKVITNSSQAAALAGAGSITAQATHNPPITASLVGAGTSNATAKVNLGAATASLAGGGGMAAAAVAIEIATPRILGGSGAIISFGGIPVPAAANLNGNGTLQIAGAIAINASAALVSEAHFDPEASVIGQLNNNLLTGAGAMICNAIHPVSVIANLGDPSFLIVDAEVEHIIYPAKIRVRTRKVRAQVA